LASTELFTVRLFFKVCPKNKDISDILIKVSTLNDFYSSNLKKIVTAAAKTFRVADSTAYHWLKEVRSGK